MNHALFSFVVTFLAGFSTLLGFYTIYLKIKNRGLFLAKILSFSSGVMTSVSFLDLIPESFLKIHENFSSLSSLCFLLFFFLIGMLSSKVVSETVERKSGGEVLYKLGVISMLALIFHNIPEGIATFLTTSQNERLGISLAIAIALHNIPEGISVAIPIYYSTKSKTRAFLPTFISALSEPLGALLAYFFLQNRVTEDMMGFLYAMIAGIMIQIACFEILPTSFSYRKRKSTILYFLFGVGVMLGSILFI